MRLVTTVVCSLSEWLNTPGGDKHRDHTLLSRPWVAVHVCGARDRGTAAAQVCAGHGQSAPPSAWPGATLREVTRCLSVSSQVLRTGILLKVTFAAYHLNLLCVGSILSLFPAISPFLAVGQLCLSTPPTPHNTKTVDSLKQTTFHQMRPATGEDKRQDRRVGIALGRSE